MIYYCIIFSLSLAKIRFDLMQWFSMFEVLLEWDWFPGFMMAEPMLMIDGNNAQLKLLYNSCWCAAGGLSTCIIAGGVVA